MEQLTTPTTERGQLLERARVAQARLDDRAAAERDMVRAEQARIWASEARWAAHYDERGWLA